MKFLTGLLTVMMSVSLLACDSRTGTDSPKPALAAAMPDAMPNIMPNTQNDLPTAWWQPRADENLRWYWQLQDAIVTTHDVDVYNIDIDTPQPIIDQLKARGIKLICYFSVGTVEWFRDDANLFPGLSR